MVDKIGLQEVAGRIGYSKRAVCHVLRGTYKGKTENVLVA
jgi:DNA transposition AAA+ family ATPase